MDALSHILDDIHLRGAEYLYVNGKGEWSFRLQGQTIFHAVLGGPVRLVIPGHGEHLLKSSDIAFIPGGLEHYIHHPTAAAEPATDLAREFRGHRNDPVTLGKGPDNSLVMSFRCLLDTEMARPLLSALPPCMLIRQGLEGRGPDWMRIGHRFLMMETQVFRPGRDTLMNRLIGMFLIECVRDHVEQVPESGDSWLRALRDPYLAPAISAMHADPARAWTVPTLAQVACLSRSAFHDRFSQVMGMPPLAYLTEHRLRLAAQHLSQGDLPVARVCDRVGYASEAAFSQAFRRQYGMTPSRYRKEQKMTPGATP